MTKHRWAQKKIDINCVHLRALVDWKLDCVISDAIIFNGAVDSWSERHENNSIVEAEGQLLLDWCWNLQNTFTFELIFASLDKQVTTLMYLLFLQHDTWHLLSAASNIFRVNFDSNIKESTVRNHNFRLQGRGGSYTM